MIWFLCFQTNFQQSRNWEMMNFKKILMLTLLSMILYLEMLEDNVFYEHLYA